jgi:hypothetical protein
MNLTFDNIIKRVTLATQHITAMLAATIEMPSVRFYSYKQNRDLNPRKFISKNKTRSLTSLTFCRRQILMLVLCLIFKNELPRLVKVTWLANGGKFKSYIGHPLILKYHLYILYREQEMTGRWMLNLIPQIIENYWK